MPKQYSSKRPITAPRTKGELAALKYKDQTYDCSLPTEWVHRMYERGFDVVPHFVFLYPDGEFGGFPVPITEEGVHMLGKVSLSV